MVEEDGGRTKLGGGPRVVAELVTLPSGDGFLGVRGWVGGRDGPSACGDRPPSDKPEKPAMNDSLHSESDARCLVTVYKFQIRQFSILLTNARARATFKASEND